MPSFLHVSIIHCICSGVASNVFPELFSKRKSPSRIQSLAMGVRFNATSRRIGSDTITLWESERIIFFLWRSSLKKMLAVQLACIGVVNLLWVLGSVGFSHLTKKRAYIVKNVVKGTSLMLMTPMTVAAGYDAIVRGTWDSDLFRLCGCMYAAHDINGLLWMWPKLPGTTRAHHICVSAMTMASMYMIDYKDPESVWRGIGVLGVFSTVTGPVNMWLGLRHVRPYPMLKWFAARLYALSMSLSLVWQAFHVMHHTSYYTIPYVVMLMVIFYDDWVLLCYMM